MAIIKPIITYNRIIEDDCPAAKEGRCGENGVGLVTIGKIGLGVLACNNVDCSQKMIQINNVPEVAADDKIPTR